MKKINLIAFTCLLLTLIIPKVEAKDSHYLYKSENSNLQVLNENIEKMFINSNYKVLRTDKDTPFYYFIPVQLSYYDWFWWGKARVRYDNYFIISAKQVNNDVYLLLTKNYYTPRRKIIILNELKNNSISFKRISARSKYFNVLNETSSKLKNETQNQRANAFDKTIGGINENL